MPGLFAAPLFSLRYPPPCSESLVGSPLKLRYLCICCQMASASLSILKRLPMLGCCSTYVNINHRRKRNSQSAPSIVSQMSANHCNANLNEFSQFRRRNKHYIIYLRWTRQRSDALIQYPYQVPFSLFSPTPTVEDFYFRSG